MNSDHFDNIRDRFIRTFQIFGFSLLLPLLLGAAPVHVERLAAGDARALSQSFSKAQISELDRTKKRQSQELKEFLASQAAHKKDWDRREKEARHRFLREHKGSENRTYVQDFIARRENLIRIQKEEENRRRIEQAVHFKALKEDQAAKLKEFREILNRGERPPERLWPENATGR